MNFAGFLEAAFARRRDCLGALEAAGTNAYRLLCGEGDGIPGLVVDRLGPVLIFQLHEGKNSLSPAQVAGMAEWYLERLPCEAVYTKAFISDRSNTPADEALYSPIPLVGKTVPERLEISEYGARFWVRPYDGFSTGIFLDQRENRRFLAERGRAKQVLNCFSYTGAFSVACARAGAVVTSVDISRRYLEWAKENFALNGLETAAHRFLVEDTFSFFKKAQKRGSRFDLIILDPPSFSRSREGVFSVQKDLGRLLESARECVAPGGAIFFSTNYSRWNALQLRQAAAAHWKNARLGEVPPIPVDFSTEPHPISAVLGLFDGKN